LHHLNACGAQVCLPETCLLIFLTFYSYNTPSELPLVILTDYNINTTGQQMCPVIVVPFQQIIYRFPCF
jgi:hypothetical protein